MLIDFKSIYNLKPELLYFRMQLKVIASEFVSKISYLRKSFGRQSFKLLDIGAGNHSATKIKSVFPNCEYHGVDLERDYNNSETDFALMTSFYEMDLTKLDMSVIPDNHFDGIWMVHVIEHLFNGDEVILKLLPKLKSSGFMYIEYPGIKSMKLPSMYGTLNFKDDPTHVRLYSVTELTKLLERNGCKVISSGTRRNIWFMMAMPFRIILDLMKGKRIQGNIFWDITGFAEFLWVQKN